MGNSTQSRRPLSKSLRFSILERDGFRCQYCGATPQNGALEVDHIIPVADGGSDDPSNLLTACEPCNKGKGRKTSLSAPLPDLTPLTEQAERFTKEVAKWRRAHKKRESTVMAAAEQMRSEHGLSVPARTFVAAIREYGVAECDYAADVTSSRLSNADYKSQVAYFWGVLRKRSAESADRAPMPEYVKPPKVIQQNGCVFGIAGTCPDCGCITHNDDGTSTGCGPLVNALGGWDTPYVYESMEHMGEIATSIRNGDLKAVATWFSSVLEAAMS